MTCNGAPCGSRPAAALAASLGRHRAEQLRPAAPRAALQEQIAEAERQKAAAIAAEDYVKVVHTAGSRLYCRALCCAQQSARAARFASRQSSLSSQQWVCLFVCLCYAGGRG